MSIPNTSNSRNDQPLSETEFEAATGDQVDHRGLLSYVDRMPEGGDCDADPDSRSRVVRAATAAAKVSGCGR